MNMDKRVQVLGFDTYREYLQSQHWREFVRHRRQKRCWVCGKSRGVVLCLHHLTYDRLGSELPDDVVTLCKGCHEDAHTLARLGTALCVAHTVLRNLLEGVSKPGDKPIRKPAIKAAGISIVHSLCPGCGNPKRKNRMMCVRCLPRIVPKVVMSRSVTFNCCSCSGTVDRAGDRCRKCYYKIDKSKLRKLHKRI